MRPAKRHMRAGAGRTLDPLARPLHALLQRGSHPIEKFVEACHLASLKTWRDSTLTVDPLNPEGR